MDYIIVGLGNPGEEYRGSRHSVGREFVFSLADDWKENPKSRALVAKGKLAGQSVILVLPETFMNKSGEAVRKFVASKKAAGKMIVVHDDLDLPLGALKISFGKSSAGHRGVESVVKAVKTLSFTRIRIGIAPVTAAGKVKKPRDEKKVIDFILGKFSPKEKEPLKKVFARLAEALKVLVSESREKAMSLYN